MLFFQLERRTATAVVFRHPGQGGCRVPYLPIMAVVITVVGLMGLVMVLLRGNARSTCTGDSTSFVWRPPPCSTRADGARWPAHQPGVIRVAAVPPHAGAPATVAFRAAGARAAARDAGAVWAGGGVAIHVPPNDDSWAALRSRPWRATQWLQRLTVRF